MGRVQLALNVANVDDAVAFYRKLFATEPAKVRPGYANFAIVDPPLKLVLIEGEQAGTLNHLGIEVASTDDVVKAAARVESEGLGTDEQMGTSCCFAVQDKVWVKGPDNDWEIYTVLGDAPSMACDASSGCCP